MDICLKTPTPDFLRLLRIKKIQQKQKEIFKRFIRASDADGGFGIGLDIVTQVCQEYNIDLDLKSKESEGSEFILIWPK